jgi:hypothetical protein
MIIVGHFISLRQLRKDYGLDVGVEIEVYIVELHSGITNCIAINL